MKKRIFIFSVFIQIILFLICISIANLAYEQNNDSIIPWCMVVVEFIGIFLILKYIK